MGERTLEDIRAEVEAWLDDSWDAELSVADWWSRLADSGWGAPTWPEEWHGKGLSRKQATAVREAFVSRKVMGAPAGLGIMLAGPTILTHGSDEQKARYLRP